MRAVDVNNNERPFSNAVAAYTDNISTTVTSATCNPNYGGRLNHETTPFALPTPSSVVAPGHPTEVSWTWQNGRDPNNDATQTPPKFFDVGPVMGNWATVKWVLPSVDATHGPANEFRLLRRSGPRSELL
ncbi:MAG TPA: hypothetical protein VJV23_13445 [Candidatus Polarisedimenticolia bacterium]|nr:hypothetical protein [Candidatus Polarisedimenticolia bacterium]